MDRDKTKKEAPIKVEILPYEKYNPSTVTVVGYFNTTVDVKKIVNFIPINHVFDEHGERVKVKPGSRKSIEYFGIDGVFISACRGNIKRGMRTGAMNNMASLDIQFEEKNIHVKLSSTAITSVGTRGIETGEKVFNAMIENISELQEMIKFLRGIDKDKMEEYIDWFIDNTYDEDEGLIRESQFLKNLKHSGASKELRSIGRCFGKYINDFDSDEQPELIEKIRELLEVEKIYSDDNLECRDVTIYNSVYHISPIKKGDKDFSMPLHKLAPFLASVGLTVEYHNWSSEGVNVCVDALEQKHGSNHTHKEYKHRFIIHETTKIRQCSPTCKEEAYRNYLGIMKLLNMFFRERDISYDQYMYDKKTNENRKLTKMIEKILV